ncbi:glycerate dehydrogenase [Acidihalobacter yilgarnensis]|uniref:Glycerate dehydrogenase n=1 Tax=Acidihalobacter yilgarnensis TaxID=2819280 RepID=A0A1D8INV6_9GAMM|nr:2-hydroxyacid dehydrogenase [Acidihalobacter yilgarnensis]AOU98111.1 glycerate dehydrogenase [Acidihalobacter yilgarnensis]
MRGAFLDLDTLDNGDLDRTPLHEAVEDWTFHAQTAGNEVAAHIGDAEVLITNKVMVDSEALQTAPRLKLICVAATGTNNVDLEAAARRGIVVCNVRDYGTASVAEHTIALMLALIRHLPEYARAVEQGQWTQARSFSLYDFFPVGELNGRTLGIVGHGVLGGAVARIAECMGMRVLISERRGAEPRPGRTAFDSVLNQADILSLHCPLTPETAHLIGAGELDRLGPEAILINTARGGLVDSHALATALREGRLGGAGLDVLDQEPPPSDHPLLATDISNLIVTPHVAWASRNARQRLVDEMAQNIRAFQAGKPRNRVA